MIAFDTSTWIAYLQGGAGEDVELLDRALNDRLAALPAPVLSEILSDPGCPPEVSELLLALPLLEPTTGFWERAGRLRAMALRAKRKARLADALIGQLCVDHAVPLVSRDRDFRAFATAAGFALVLP